MKASRIGIRRAADITTRNVAKSTKTGGERVVDIDPATAAGLKSYKALRGSISTSLARADSNVFGNNKGEIRSPNEVSRRWRFRVVSAQKAPRSARDHPQSAPAHPRDAAARAREHPKIVQECLGHSTITTTMNIYSHVTPTMQRAAIDSLASHI